MLFSERLPICIVHDDLGWKNREQHVIGLIAGFLPRHWLYE